jgi:CRP/FNR family cyclic AMP-dependent transcriptional regulator
MLSRFKGVSGRALLLDVLASTTLLRGLTDLSEFIDNCEFFEVAAGNTIISQGGSDNSIYLVLSGSFNVTVNGRQWAIRGTGSHLGEMALIDPTARRSATATASEDSLVANAPEAFFSAYADKHPVLWRRLAAELCKRLMERTRLTKAPRSEPVLFLGCSTEAIGIAREIQAAFSHDPFVVEIWTDGVFNASKTPIEDLTDLVGKIDFVAVLLTPDDKITSRRRPTFSPRDNVVFELGLAIGAIGRARTFVVVERGSAVKFPSDLLGVNPVDYPSGPASSIKSRLGPACNEIRKIMNRLGPI